MPVSIGRLVAALAVLVTEGVSAALVAKVAVAVAAARAVSVAAVIVVAVSMVPVSMVAVAVVCVVDPGPTASCPRAESSAAERPETMER
jgi:hypothetical protein